MKNMCDSLKTELGLCYYSPAPTLALSFTVTVAVEVAVTGGRNVMSKWTIIDASWY